ncbi:DUF397 domain-containing protein [Streptomyces sp. C]|uniref:DUF397 domain-containing protein n=1 Tax=unclassified Streptomyces TaxID=2593676 RepID=UPI0001B56C69|nr:DUF397 domain-containing protein [Streptomyces sp. C]EFL13874.1 predicted protein [Streptomyces sp. C]
MAQQDLYSLPIEGAEFTKHCGGNLQGDHEACVEYAAIPGSTEGFVLTDTKAGGAGQQLRFTTEELDNFVLGYAEKRGLSI